jgi:hypothetical protein
MNASKENCVEALSKVSDLQYLATTSKSPPGVHEHLQFIGDFLASAAKRLPREVSLIKDRNRKRAKK